MPTRSDVFDPRTIRIAGIALAVGIAALVLAALLAPSIVARGVRSAAAKRGLVASWHSMRLVPPAHVSFHRFVLAHPGADTVFYAESLGVSPQLGSIFRGSPRPALLRLSHGVIRSIRSAPADPDTLAPEESDDRAGRDATRKRAEEMRSRKVKQLASEMVRLFMLPARRLPRLELHDVVLRTAGNRIGMAGADSGDSTAPGIGVAWLELVPARGGIRLAGAGAVLAEHAIPFSLDLRYGADDRLLGNTRFLIPRPGAAAKAWSVASATLDDTTGYEPLRVEWNARVRQERSAGRVTLVESSSMTLGRIPITLSGSLDRKGPEVRFALGADRVTRERIRESVPEAVLGPLTGLAVRGSFDYRLQFHLDFDQPDSVDFEADVIPHGLALDPAHSRLNLTALQGPFTAVIHLPRGRLETRSLSSDNPHFRPLPLIDSLLVHAVVTNEDGAFFRHRGFNTDAVKSAIAANLKAGAYRRGAGTITMQLVRNLYLGHERSLSRKAQEVVLAWVVEHLTGVPKWRLLEIYLNIIEWGPGVHGADEAAWFYFGHDAGRLTIDEALFLAIVVPAPSKWRYRFDKYGELRSFARGADALHRAGDGGARAARPSTASAERCAARVAPRTGRRVHSTGAGARRHGVVLEDSRCLAFDLIGRVPRALRPPRQAPHALPPAALPPERRAARTLLRSGPRSRSGSRRSRRSSGRYGGRRSACRWRTITRSWPGSASSTRSTRSTRWAVPTTGARSRASSTSRCSRAHGSTRPGSRPRSTWGSSRRRSPCSMRCCAARSRRGQRRRSRRSRCSPSPRERSSPGRAGSSICSRVRSPPVRSPPRSAAGSCSRRSRRSRGS